MTKTVLFVGGCANGEIRDFDSPMDRIDVNVRVSDGLGKQVYRRQFISIYLADGESPDNLIPLLIEGYKKVKE